MRLPLKIFAIVDTVNQRLIDADLNYRSIQRHFEYLRRQPADRLKPFSPEFRLISFRLNPKYVYDPEKFTDHFIAAVKGVDLSQSLKNPDNVIQ